MKLKKMAPPKKLPYAERMAKKENDKIVKEVAIIHDELTEIYKGLQKETEDFETWHWAALETFRILQKDFPAGNRAVQIEKGRALAIAREAQLAMNFTQ